MLKKRIDDIQQIIDHHFNLIKGAVKKDREDKYYKEVMKEEAMKKKLENDAKQQKTSRSSKFSVKSK